MKQTNDINFIHQKFKSVSKEKRDSENGRKQLLLGFRGYVHLKSRQLNKIHYHKIIFFCFL